VILSAGDWRLELPADTVAQIIVVHERNSKGKVKRSTALMRLSEKDLLKAKANFCGPKDIRAMPTYWCPATKGDIAVWPNADQDYDIEAMGRHGKPLAGSRSPAAVAPVQSMIAAIAKAQEDELRNAMPTMGVVNLGDDE
jgi:hypothetical protein